MPSYHAPLISMGQPMAAYQHMKTLSPFEVLQQPIFPLEHGIVSEQQMAPGEVSVIQTKSLSATPVTSVQPVSGVHLSGVSHPNDVGAPTSLQPVSGVQSSVTSSQQPDSDVLPTQHVSTQQPVSGMLPPSHPV